MSLLEQIKDLISPEFIEKAIQYFGEDPAAMDKAIKAIFPAALKGIIHKVESGDVATVINTAKQVETMKGLNNLPALLSTEGGGIPEGAPAILSSLFGNKTGAIANAISNYAGVKGSTAGTLLGIVTPAILSLMGKNGEGELNAPQVLSMLNNVKSGLGHMSPAGFNLLGLFNSTTEAAIPHSTTHSLKEAEKRRSGWLMPILSTLALLIALLYIIKGCGKKEDSHKVDHTTSSVSVKPDDRSETNMVTVKESMMVQLPNGIKINAFKGGIEDQLIQFIKDPSTKVDKEIWFDFIDLNFEFGTAKMIDNSKTEVENLVEILKAFPNVKIKVGGYTDKVGDENANLKLSMERANAVKSTLEDAGVGSQVVGAEGYGSQFAKFPSDAPEDERKKDRRVSISVREK